MQIARYFSSKITNNNTEKNSQKSIKMDGLCSSVLQSQKSNFTVIKQNFKAKVFFESLSTMFVAFYYCRISVVGKACS